MQHIYNDMPKNPRYWCPAIFLDMYRPPLNNTREDLPVEDFKVIVNNYSQKLINSGHGEDQVRSIVVAGIKGWEGKVTSCKDEGR